MKNEIKRVKSTLILLAILFIIISLLNIIFKHKHNLLITSLVYIVNAILLPEWIRDKNMKIRYKIFLVAYVFVLSSIILFYFQEFEKNKFYILWFCIMTIIPTIMTTISKSIKNRNKI